MLQRLNRPSSPGLPLARRAFTLSPTATLVESLITLPPLIGNNRITALQGCQRTQRVEHLGEVGEAGAGIVEALANRRLHALLQARQLLLALLYTR